MVSKISDLRSRYKLKLLNKQPVSRSGSMLSLSLSLPILHYLNFIAIFSKENLLFVGGFVRNYLEH